MSTDIQLNPNQSLSIITDEKVITDFRVRMENYTALLNKAPKKEDIQKHQGYEYLPISFIEKQLDELYFGAVQYECVTYSQIFNEIACHARIKVLHPVLLQWMVYDGVGSAVIQQDANTKVIDFHQFKKPNALQLTLPKAYAEAIKNAAKKIGKLFGADINRKFEDQYEPMLKGKTEKKQKELDRLMHMIDDATTIEDLKALRKDVPESLYEYFDNKAVELGGMNV